MTLTEAQFRGPSLFALFFSFLTCSHTQSLFSFFFQSWKTCRTTTRTSVEGCLRAVPAPFFAPERVVTVPRLSPTSRLQVKIPLFTFGTACFATPTTTVAGQTIRPPGSPLRHIRRDTLDHLPPSCSPTKADPQEPLSTPRHRSRWT